MTSLDLVAARRRLGSEHLTAAIVAAAVVAVGLLSGGYGAQVRAAITLLTWWTVILVIVLGVRPRSALPGAAAAAVAGLGGLAALTALSLSWASDDGRAFTEVVRVAGYLGLLVLVVLLSRPGGGRALLAGLTAGLVGLAGIALGSRLEPSLFPEPALIRVVPAIQNRLSYPIGYWNALGSCMAMAIVLLAWFQCAARAKAARIVAAALIPVPALALLFTSSRGGVAALAAGAVVLVAVEPRRVQLLVGVLPAVCGSAVLALLALQQHELVDGPVRGHAAATQGDELLALTLLGMALVAAARNLIDPFAQRVRVSRRAGAGLVAAAAVLALAGLVVADLPRRLDEFNDPLTPRQQRRVDVVQHLQSSNGRGRYQLWQSAWSAFEDEPLRGIGAGGYEAWWTREGSIFHPVRDAHSLYLETLAELGIVGGLLLALFFGAIVAGAARAAQRSEAAAALGVVAAGSMAAAIDWVWEVPVVFGVVVIAAAVLVGPALRRPAAPGRGSRRAVAAFGALAVVGVVVGAFAYVGEAELSDSRVAADRGELGRAADASLDAHAALPWSAAPWQQLALVEERRDLPAALAAANRALADAPDDWRIWVIAARLRTKAGDLRGAARALVRARTLNPHTPLLKRG